jgi:hypothetical protein
VNEEKTSPATATLMSNQTYNRLKWVAQILLPALGALYFGLGEIWGLPRVTEIVGTLTVVDTFLGVLLGLSSRAYHNSDERFDGSIDIHETEDKKAFLLNLDGDPNQLDQKSEVVFKVRNNP